MGSFRDGIPKETDSNSSSDRSETSLGLCGSISPSSLSPCLKDEMRGEEKDGHLRNRNCSLRLENAEAETNIGCSGYARTTPIKQFPEIRKFKRKKKKRAADGLTSAYYRDPATVPLLHHVFKQAGCARETWLSRSHTTSWGRPCLNPST